MYKKNVQSTKYNNRVFATLKKIDLDQFFKFQILY